MSDNNQTNNSRPFAVVTGGSSGIGRCLASELASRGYNVAICSENRDELVEAAEQLRIHQDARIDIIEADLATREGVMSFYEAVQSFGPVDVFCANAGVGTYGLFNETDLETELRIVDLNVRAVLHTTKLISKDMVARGQGKILITASIESFLPDAYQTVYGASKSFDFMFSEGIRESLKGTGVTVTALLPGATDTPFFFKAGATESKVYQETPLARPEDVAKTAIKALMDGDDHVVHGVANKIMATLAQFAPPTWVAKFGRKAMMEPVETKKAS